jgi:hemerythrin-like domain-containing protein
VLYFFSRPLKLPVLNNQCTIEREGGTMTEMSPIAESLLCIHKIISRALHVSIQKCDEYIRKQGIPREEVVGFLMYVTTLKWITHSHHLTEDDMAFPYFRDKLEAPYTRLEADHQVIARILVNMDKYLSEISSGGVGKLLEVLGEFDKLWGPHITIEEEHFAADKLKPVAGTQEQVNLVARFAEHGKKNSGPGPLALPFMFYNLEGADREAFLIPFPWIVKKVLVPILWRGKWQPMSPFLLV